MARYVQPQIFEALRRTAPTTAAINHRRHPAVGARQLAGLVRRLGAASAMISATLTAISKRLWRLAFATRNAPACAHLKTLLEGEGGRAEGVRKGGSREGLGDRSAGFIGSNLVIACWQMALVVIKIPHW